MKSVDLPKNSNKTYSFVFVTVVLVAIFFVVGYFIGKTDVRTNISSETTAPVSLSSFFDTISSGLNISSKDKIDPKLINEVYDVIKTQYVDKDISAAKLYNGAIKGMVESLGDSPSIFFTSEETNDYKKSIRGDFEGIGAELGYRGGRVIVKRLLPDSPASKSSLKVGDMILKVDDSTIKENEDISIVVGKIRGQAGTEVKLSVSDTTIANAREVKITRAAIHSESMDLVDEGKVYLFDPTDESHYDKIIGISLNSAILNDPVNIITSGEMITSGLTPDSQYYAGLGGVLTTTIPTTGVQVRVGYSIDSNKMFIKIQEPIII
jgi:membrane-associated protease RseP (regulator of RpoE activity)